LVQREERAAAAAFLGLCVSPLVREKILERSEQEGAQPATVRVGQLDLLSFEETGEESLSEIQRVIRAVLRAADEGVNRMPISLA